MIETPKASQDDKIIINGQSFVLFLILSVSWLLFSRSDAQRGVEVVLSDPIVTYWTT